MERRTRRSLAPLSSASPIFLAPRASIPTTTKLTTSTTTVVTAYNAPTSLVLDTAPAPTVPVPTTTASSSTASHTSSTRSSSIVILLVLGVVALLSMLLIGGFYYRRARRRRRNPAIAITFMDDLAPKDSAAPSSISMGAPSTADGKWPRAGVSESILPPSTVASLFDNGGSANSGSVVPPSSYSSRSESRGAYSSLSETRGAGTNSLYSSRTSWSSYRPGSIGGRGGVHPSWATAARSANGSWIPMPEPVAIRAERSRESSVAIIGSRPTTAIRIVDV